MSDPDNDWVLNFLTLGNFFWSFFFFRFHFYFSHFIFFEFSFSFVLFISWEQYYRTLKLTRFWHYLSLTITRSLHCLTLTFCNTDIVWHWYWLSSDIFESWTFFLFIFLWHFIFVCDFIFFDIIYFLIISDSDIN